MVTTPEQPELPGVPAAPEPPHLTLGPGIYRDVSRELYLSDPCITPSLSNSIAQLVLDAPSKARLAHPRLGGANSSATRSMRAGSLLDSLLLGGEDEFVVMPEEMPDADGVMKTTKGERRLKGAKEWAAAQEALGKQVVGAGALAEARVAAEGIRENLKERHGLEFTGENQLVIVWEDEGVLCRARLDHWLEEHLLIVDLKRCESAHPDKIADHMHRYGYDTQHHAYVRAMEAARPELAGRVRMVFAFVEAEPPYETLVVGPAGSMRSLGRWKWERARELWAACLQEGKWPGYRVPPNGIEARPWAMYAMEQSIPLGGSPGVTF